MTLRGPNSLVESGLFANSLQLSLTSGAEFQHNRLPLQLFAITKTRVTPTHVSLSFAYECLLPSSCLAVPRVKVHHVNHKQRFVSCRGTTTLRALTDGRGNVQPPNTARQQCLQAVQNDPTAQPHIPRPCSNIIVSPKWKLNDDHHVRIPYRQLTICSALSLTNTCISFVLILLL